MTAAITENSTADLALRYPILLVHGMGFRDSRLLNYWGRIPKTLEKHGCKVFYGLQDSNASIETNAQFLADRIETILAQTGAEKLNIIAHSKGGLDCRYAISSLGCGDKVASLTTMSTPHHGSKTVDLLLRFPDFPVRFVGFCTDCWFRVIGDKKPSTYNVFHSFTTAYAEDFNRRNPDDERVYYQSYAFVMKNPTSDVFMWLPNLFVRLIEGENDGLLTPDSTRWSHFQGVRRGVSRRGISHCDEVDMRRWRLSKKRGDGVSDITEVYMEAIQHLREHGL